MTTNNIKEEILGEFDEKFDNGVFGGGFRHPAKDFLLSSLDKYANAKLEEAWKGIKNYDFKEKHICGFNDGKQDCDCFIAGLNATISIINNLKTK